MAEGTTWGFLTNHTLVLLCVLRDRTIRMRDVAKQVRITERAVQRIVAELAQGGYLTIKRNGRRNQYSLGHNRDLRHELVGWDLSTLLGALNKR
jgi:hypothetical protein